MTEEKLMREVQSLSDRIKSLQPELKIQLAGFDFASIQPQSAKALYGKRWQDAVHDFVSPEEIFSTCRFSFQPDDVMLAAITCSKPHGIKQGREVQVTVSAGDESYNGIHIAIHADLHRIVIPLLKKGDASGIYHNTGKIAYLQNKVKTFEQRIQEIQDSVAGIRKVQEELCEPVVIKRAEENKKRGISALEVVLLLLAASGVAYMLFQKEKSVTV